jgi:hypothetical protein
MQQLSRLESSYLSTLACYVRQVWDETDVPSISRHISVGHHTTSSQDIQSLVEHLPMGLFGIAQHEVSGEGDVVR